MKLHKTLTNLAVILGVTSLPLVGFGQVFDFTLAGTAIDGGYGIDPSELSAEGSITFDLASSTISFSVTNTSTVESYITGIYLLAPTTLPSGDPIQLASIVPDVITPANWDYVASGPDNFNNLLNPLPQDKTDYFGAETGNPPSGIPSPPSTTFDFAFSFAALGETVMDVDAWLNGIEGVTSGTHQILVRWQRLGDEQVDGSAKSWASGSGGLKTIDERVVPEPHLIAPLAVLGMGGLLWTRRRLTKKN